MYEEQRVYEIVPPPVPPIMTLSDGGTRHQFMAWLPQGIAGPKVSGFVTEQGAEVLKVRTDELRLRIGRKRWLPRSWREQGQFPIELTIRVNQETNCVRSLTHVIVDIRAQGSGISQELQQQRLSEVICALRYRLMAQELELEKE